METDNRGAARLARLSSHRSKRLATETGEQRAARLARLSANQSERLTMENEELRAARLARLSTDRSRPSQLSTPLLEQRPVNTKMPNYHCTPLSCVCSKVTFQFPAKPSRSGSPQTMSCMSLVIAIATKTTSSPSCQPQKNANPHAVEYSQLTRPFLSVKRLASETIQCLWSLMYALALTHSTPS